MNITRIDLAAEDPDAWALEMSLRLTRARLKKTSRWRFIERQDLLREIELLEDALRRLTAKRDADAIERTRKLLEGDQ